MAKEIERKFLVKGNSWRHLTKGTKFKQGYLSTDKERSVRIRTIKDKGYITIKGISVGATRSEYEYEIPFDDAKKMLNELCVHPLIEKTRFKIQYGNILIEVDEFFGENEGLILAEVELNNENQQLNLPDWIGKEVTNDSKYFNVNLVKNPFKNWPESKDS